MGDVDAAMGDVNAEQRQKAKAGAANIAVVANDTAVVLGAAGIIVTGAGVASGVGALAGVGAGVALGVCSFGAWSIGNRYQRLANDPPRDDFDQLTISTASITDAGLPPDEPDAITLLERFDGAQAAGDAAAASAPADAAQQNANAALAAQQALRALADPLNQGLGRGLQDTLDAISGLADPDLCVDADIASHPLMSAGEMPSERARARRPPRRSTPRPRRSAAWPSPTTSERPTERTA